MTPFVAVAPTPDWRLAGVLALLLAVALVASYVGRLHVGGDQVTAAVRAVLQLAVVASVIAATLESLVWSAAFALLMFTVATATSARRIGVGVRGALWVGVAIAAGAAPVLALSLGSGVIPFNGAGIIPMAGIIIGGMMTAATLSGRRASDELAGQQGAYEAALALGMTSADSAYLVLEPTAREALNPGLDQTRTVGLVTLPGAFVGVLLGGGTPVQAGSAQILVLIGLLSGQAVTAAVLLRLVASARIVRRDLQTVFPR